MSNCPRMEHVALFWVVSFQSLEVCECRLGDHPSRTVEDGVLAPVGDNLLGLFWLRFSEHKDFTLMSISKDDETAMVGGVREVEQVLVCSL